MVFQEARKLTGRMSKNVRIKDLPVYKADGEIVFVDDPPLALEPYMGQARVALEPAYEFICDSTSSLEKMTRSAADSAKKLQDYVANENQSAIPKAVAITLGGMGGFLLGMRRGGVPRRIFYSGIGMGLLAAFCYPNQTMDIGRTASTNIRHQWDEFVASPKPPTKSKESSK